MKSAFAIKEDGGLARPHVGTMNFGRRTSEADAKAILARALELGIEVFDTANAYVDGESERIVGEAIGKHRDRVTLATKCGFGRSGGKPEGLSRTRLPAALDESLKRLGTDWVDVYYLHVPDHATPIAETLDALAELLEKRKIRAWGVSNYAAWQILEMFQLADARKMPRPIVAQQLYNVLLRQLDVEYLPFARHFGLHTTVYNPLAGGLLSGKHVRDGSTQKGSRFDKNRLYQGRYFTDVMFDRLDDVARVARDAGLGLVELAYAWASGARGVDSVLLGPATMEHLEAGIAGCKRTLEPEVRKKLDALYPVWSGTETTYVR